MTVASPATTAFREARDKLLALRGQHATAVETFRWPDLGERFCWAVDWFDAYAQGNDRPGLVIVEEDGRWTSLTFAELSHRSDQLAVWLRGQGVAKGDPVIL